MRILLINYEYPPVGGGASNATWEIARAMVKLGQEPVVLTARYGDRQPDTANPGIKVIEVPAIRRRKDRCSILEMATFVASATWRIRRILRRERIEGMIAFFSIPCGPIAWWGWRGTKIPYIVSLRGGDVPGMEPGLAGFHRLLRPLRRTVMRRANAVVANSNALKDAAEKADPFTVDVIPNGVDTDFWQPPSERPPLKPFRLLFVGRLHAQKNLGWMLEQLAKVDRLPPCPDWILDVVGDGPLTRELRLLACQLGILKRVRWHGWLPRHLLLERYHHAHCLVNPSIYEGMPNVILEALSCGLNVLASAIPSHQNVFSTHSQIGLFSLGDGAMFQRLILETFIERMPRGNSVGGTFSRVNLSWSATAQAYLRKNSLGTET